jgi:hypothetical protein
LAKTTVTTFDAETGVQLAVEEIEAPGAEGPDIATLADQVTSIIGALDMLILNEFGA